MLQIREAKVSKFKFMHTFSESKSIFAIEQKVIISCFVKDVTLLLGHPLYLQFYGKNAAISPTNLVFERNLRNLNKGHLAKVTYGLQFMSPFGRITGQGD